MFAPRGFSGSELGDVEVIHHDGVFHLFHLTLPNHDVIGHAVSTDGIVWEPRPAALTTGPPGAFDDDQLWTMSVLFRDARFHMLYTALCRADAGRVQRMGRAVSDDLETWDKLPGPVSEARAPYRTDRDGAPWVAWRDPKPVVLDDGRVHVVLCARDPEAPALRQGAVAHLVSDDMRRWDVLPPLFVSRRHFELECPQVFSLGGRFYLTAAILEERAQRYWFSDALDGPYRAPDDNRLLPAGHYAARVCSTGDEHLVFAFHDPGGCSDSRARFVPSPLILAPATDGSLTCRRAAAWDARITTTRDLTDDDFVRFEPRYRARGARRVGGTFTAPEGTELFFDPGPGDVRVTANVSVAAPLFGLAVSAGPDGSGTLVELDRGTRRVRVVSREAATDAGTPWFTERIRAEGRYVPSARMAVEVIRAGGELIVSIDGVVAVATSHMASPEDGLGFLVDSGQIAVAGCAVSHIRL